VIAGAIGLIFYVIGALLRILHWEFDLNLFKFNGNVAIFISTVFWNIGASFLIIKVLKADKSSIMNS